MKHLLVLSLAALTALSGCTTSEVSSASLRAPFADNKAQTDACYQKTLKKQPDMGSGTVELRFAINAEGKATKTTFMKKKSTISNKLLNACLKKVVHSWQFPEGKAIDVNYAFLFEDPNAELSSESEGEPKKESNLDVIDTSPQEESSGDEETPAE